MSRGRALQLTTAGPVSRALVVWSLAASPLLAEVRLASPFTSHMVLQRDARVPVWGTAEAGERVSVEFASQKRTAVAGADGKWRVDLDSLKASVEARPFTVSGSRTAQPLRLDDVLVGEVWLASGQSNMVFPVSKARARWAGVVGEEQEIASANWPKIRMFTSAETKTYEPQTSVGGTWAVCSPESVPGFSAIGYMFARELHRELSVPVGILAVAYGASTAEAWISREAMTADAKLKPLVDALDTAVKFYRENPGATADEAPTPPRTINARPRTPGQPQRDPVQDQHYPSVLWNGMLHPLVPYAIRGALWYQGESICGGTPGIDLYGHVQRTLIKDWRARFAQGDFPFYLVQLPGQENVSNNPRIREEQAAVLALPKTGMVVTIDLGEARDVHPHNKVPVANRLARLALARVYGRRVVSDSPMFERLRVERGVARITFAHSAGGLVAKGGSLKGFQVAGGDRNFVDADARIEGDSVVVSSPQVRVPVAVRYAWDNYPEGLGCNLQGAAGLPAAPFRTDTWDYPIPGIVEK